MKIVTNMNKWVSGDYQGDHRLLLALALADVVINQPEFIWAFEA